MKAVHAVKEKAQQAQERIKQKSLERKRKKVERELERKQEIEAQIAYEKSLYEEEKNRLVSLSEKELIAEGILAIRGFYNEFIELKEAQEELENDIARLESILEDIVNDNKKVTTDL